LVGRAFRKILILIVAVLLPFAALLLIMTLSQADLLFPVHAVPPAGPLPSGAERLQLAAPGGDALHGVHLKPAVDRPGPRLLLIGFGGNAWNGQEVATYLHGIFPEAHVVAFHYRGYRPSTGSPSAEALLEDAPLLFDEAVKRVQPDRTIVAGFSIGSGVAARLSRKRDVDGAILVTPFDSLKAVAQELYPWLPVGPFFQHEMAAADDLADGDTPIAILAAERDEIIPASRTDALRQRVPNLKFDRTVGGAGHNDIYHRSDFQDSLREALATIAAP
jgi:pimeloyl-ACP methyl ester carboxylesterase